MRLSPDETVFLQYGFVSINATIVWTWAIMLLLVVISILVTRNLRTDIHISRWQCLLEMLVKGINKQIEEVGLKQPEKYIGFLGTLFLLALPISASFFRYTNLRRVRSQQRLLWR